MACQQYPTIVLAALVGIMVAIAVWWVMRFVPWIPMLYVCRGALTWVWG